MDGVGKVHHCGAPWQGHDLALGGEHIHGIGEQVDLDVVPKFSGVACFGLDVQKRLQPLRAQALGLGAGRLVFFVQPVRGHPRFGDQVHRLGAHLKLNVHARRPDQGGVQRLVAVDLGNGDVVLEFTGQRLVNLVQQAQSGVAVDD